MRRGDPFRLPRELASDIVWLGDCYESPYEGEILHGYDSVFLIRGSDSSMLVEAGIPMHASAIEAQLAEALETCAPVRYLFPTHQETPHAGGLVRLLDQCPEATVVGDVRDYHLVFPEHAERFESHAIGAELDLGGLTARIVEPVIKDLPSTQWLVIPERKALFAGDGFSFAHHHRAGQCGRVASELPELDIAGLGHVFIEFALHWLRFVDPEDYVAALERCIREHEVTFIGPTHGLPIVDVAEAMPQIYAGLRRAAEAAEA